MTVTIYFTESLLDNLSEINKNCFSIYSPLNEVLGSLHVLLNPDGHGLMTTWASETKQVMDEQILQELNYFSPFYKSKIPNFFIEEIIYEESSIEKQISLLGTNLLGKDKGLLINELKDFKDSKLMEDLVENADLVFLNFFSFLKMYYKYYFKDFVQKTDVFNVLNHYAMKQRKCISKQGFLRFLQSIDSNQIYWVKNAIKIQTKMNKKYYLGKGEKIIFLPSSVTWPHVRVNKMNEKIILTYNVNSRNIGNLARQEMSEIFKALSDPTRIDFLYYLHEGKKTTKSLAQILVTSESTVSHHLNILKKAGIVNNIRNGKRVFYYNTDKVKELIPNFFLDIT